MKKYLSLLLASLMLASALTACAGSPADPAVDGTATDGTTAPAETEPVATETKREDTKDNLPADLNLKGLAVNIITRDASSIRPYDVDGGGEESGDIVKDAVYQRNRKVEERLDVKFNVTASTETWKNVGNLMESTILAGDDTWNLYFAQGNMSYSSKRDYLFQDLSKNKYIDYDQPWWWTDAMEELSLDGTMIRYLVGDIVLNNYTRSSAMYFNKDLYKSALGNPDDLYQLVIDRKWTYDKLMEYATKSYVDVNGDGKVGEGDRYGLYVGYNQWLNNFAFSSDATVYTRHADGYPVLALDLDRAQSHLEKLNKLFWETTGATFVDAKEVDNRTLFASGGTVFYAGRLHDALNAEHRDMAAEYGIIPYPLQDEKQEEYYGIIDNSGNYPCVPVTCTYPDDIGAVVEAMCSESYRSVILPFYETALKTKYSRDSMSGQCIDIIIDTCTINFIYTYNTAIGGGNFLPALIKTNSNDLASAYAAKVETINKNIVELVASMQKLSADQQKK